MCPSCRMENKSILTWIVLCFAHTVFLRTKTHLLANHFNYFKTPMTFSFDSREKWLGLCDSWDTNTHRLNWIDTISKQTAIFLIWQSNMTFSKCIRSVSVFLSIDRSFCFYKTQVLEIGSADNPTDRTQTKSIR